MMCKAFFKPVALAALLALSATPAARCCAVSDAVNDPMAIAVLPPIVWAFSSTNTDTPHSAAVGAARPHQPLSSVSCSASDSSLPKDGLQSGILSLISPPFGKGTSKSVRPECGRKSGHTP